MTKGLGYLLFLAALAFFATAQTPGQSCEQEENTLGCKAPWFLNRLTLFLPGRSSPRPTKSPTIKLDTIALAEYYGYGAERHSITTEDGYILEVHRIYSKQDTGSSKPVVLVHHAWLLNSREFLTLGPGKALGYLLADEGYDVWFCNARGNTHSRRHITKSPDSPEFWNFSYTEHGMYDVPAVIDYALRTTGRTKVHYIGHSIGTITFLIMGSKRPEVLSKVQSYTALAPLTTATNGRSTILRGLMRSYRLVAAGFEKMGAYEMLPHKKWLTLAGYTVCKENWYTQVICTAFLFALSGNNPEFDKSILQEMLSHSPSGSSTKTFRHFGQNFYNGFREYDYGAEENLQRYKSEQPPLFDYSKINVPSQLYIGANDLMADPKDAEVICKTLPNVYRCEQVEDEKFSHLDFIWAKNAPTVLYEKILEGLKHFEG